MSGSKKYVPGPCSVCGRVGKVRRGLCGAHYEQVRKRGSIIHAEIRPTSGPVTSSPTYRTVHSRLTLWRGPAGDHPCADCGDQAAQWAFDNQDPKIVDDRGLTYSDDLDRYRPLCARCHLAADGKPVVCQHPPEKERYSWGACKECHREKARIQALRKKEVAR